MKARPTLLYPKTFFAPKQIASKLKKLIKKAENEQHNKMLIERTKLIRTLTTQIFLGYLKLFCISCFPPNFSVGPIKAQYDITIKILSNGREGR
jgi:hypothetical protein